MSERKAEKVIAAVALATAFLMGAAGAGWREQASGFDIARLAKIDEARAKALDEASRGASPGDLAAIDSVLHAPAVAASPEALGGAWRCRTIKLGGIAPDVIYSWFRCRISARGGALYFEKLSGSQRTSGYLYGESQGFVYLGASTVTGEKPHAYSGNGAEAGAPATPDDQIGFLSLVADGRARLEMPLPLQESTFDVIELKR